MTIAEIILRNRIFLMEQGVLKATEERVVYVDDDGKQKETFLPEEIHTFNAWKKMGYVVNKGEHAVAKFPIWKVREKRKADSDDKEKDDAQDKKMFMKMAFFFTADQVKKMEGKR